ncbi:stage V sporulation protein B [Paenibacillus marinisediminis]
MKKQTFIQGTLILLAAGLINRILGFIPRIMLPRIIGAEGVGIYQLGYPFLLVMLTLITGGVPLAVSKLVAESDSRGDTARSYQIMRTALLLTTTAGVILSGICLLLAPWVTSHLLTDKRVYNTFMVMTPIIVLVAISSVLRGYFQGKQNMIPTATSQVTETLIRIVGIIACAYLLLPYGLEWAAAGAMIGVVLGELGGLGVLVYELYRSRRSSAPHAAVQPAHRESRSILRIALPVTGGKLVGSLSYLLESITIARSLVIAGIATTTATALYGALQGMVMPLLLLPGALTYSLSVSLVPSLSEAYGRKDMKTIHLRLHQAIRLALVSGAPFAVVMFVLALPICTLLYNDPSVAPMLRWLAPIAIFIYVQSPLQAALQALDRPGTALINTLIGAAVKIILILQLASLPSLGMKGAILAICANTILVTVLHSVFIMSSIKLKFPWIDLFKILIAMIIMAGAVQYVYIHLPFGDSHVILRFISACTIGLLLYLLLLVIMKLIDRDDLTRVPIIKRWFVKNTTT